MRRISGSGSPSPWTSSSSIAPVATARWSPRLAYLAAAPLALAVLWNLYQSLAALLPNVY